ncbi:GAF domain-containing protein [Scytonema sp. NUACC26]|uniref:GAF domain-containing protein n=1 Tax=Scytonema sp. NUACC26 TaxID=3140176 RepID=UPI0034DC1A6D
MKRDASGKFVSNWDSESKQRVCVSLTSTAWRSLDEEARRQGISRSELIERVARSFGNERQQQFLIELNDMILAIQDPKEIMWQVERATGQYFNVTRCTYGEIDDAQEYVIVKRDYCNGVISVVGNHYLDSFGIEIIAELKQGKTLVIDDVDVDPRTSGSGAAAFATIQTKAVLCVPLVKEGRFVALFVLHHVSPRHWTEEDVTLMEQIAEQTWLAVERTQAEEALRKSQARLQLALMVGRMGTWDWDMQLNQITWSEGQYTIMGLQPNECKPSYEVWVKSVHPDDIVQAETALQQAMLEKKEYYHEYRTLWADASIHWTEARGQFSYNAEGQPTRMIGVLIDITERKQAEQEREQLLERERIAHAQVETAQRQLATIFETSPVGIGWLNEQQRFIAINEALAQINGLTREQHLGYSISELFGQSDPKLVEVFHDIYTTGNPFISPNFAVNVPGRRDRTPGYYNVYYLPTTNSHREVEDVLVYVVDVTERVRLEQGQRFLSEASAVLASSLDYQTTLERVAQLAVSELADWCTVHMIEEDGSIEQIAVAHTDPAKLHWAQEIRHKYPLNLNEPRGAALTLRTGQSDILPNIPDELLVQAARDPEHLEILRQIGFRSVMSVPLRTQVRILGVISFISAESGRQYDSTDLELAEELAHRASLAIDKNRLQQVFWNLLSNAVKFTLPGGRVEVQLEQVGTYAQIQVKDTGIGISPEFLPHVFEYFRQENSTMTRQFGGLGLGLAIVRQITELHGGTVLASSAGENLGATFTVRLPLNVIEQEPFANDRPSESEIHLAGIEILVVDDDEDMRDLAKFILTQASAQVMTAGSAVEALNLLNQSVPDVLLCDIGMPEMDGYSLIQHVRKLSPLQGGTIPAIALTAYAGEINQQQALAAGFNMHLSKPVEPDKLVEAIVKLLDVVAIP